jgi:hypothetical protein
MEFVYKLSQNSTLSFKYYKNIKKSSIIDEIYKLKKINNSQKENYKKIFDSMLQVIAKNRLFDY